MDTLHNIGRGNMGVLSLYAFGFLSLVEWFPMTNPRDSCFLIWESELRMYLYFVHAYEEDRITHRKSSREDWQSVHSMQYVT